MANELKPCPFCGGSNLDTYYCDIEGWIAHIKCDDCDDMIGPMSEFKYETKEEAYEDASKRWNTRPAAPVEGLETIGYVHRGTVGLLMEGAVSKAVIVQKPGGDFKHPVVFAEQAEAIIAAERNRAEVAEYKLDQSVNIVQPMIIQRAERAEGEISEISGHLDCEPDSDSILHTIREIQANNAALTARVKELEEDRDSWRRVSERLERDSVRQASEMGCLSTQLEAAKSDFANGIINAAATRYCGGKERETFYDDILYFRNNWRALPGLTKYVIDELARAALEAKP